MSLNNLHIQFKRRLSILTYMLMLAELPEYHKHGFKFYQISSCLKAYVDKNFNQHFQFWIFIFIQNTKTINIQNELHIIFVYTTINLTDFQHKCNKNGPILLHIKLRNYLSFKFTCNYNIFIRNQKLFDITVFPLKLETIFELLSNTKEE